MFSSAMFDFQKMRSLGTTQMVTSAFFYFHAFLTVHTSADLYAFFIFIHFQERFQIDAVSMETLSVLVWTEGENALVWIGKYHGVFGIFC